MSHSAIDPSPELPEIRSPYPRDPNRSRLSAWEHIKIASYWFGSNFLWGAFLGPVLSSHMNRLYAEDPAKILGLLYMIGAIPALFVPLIFGPISDRCTSKMGRRRPYILTGGLVTMVGLLLMMAGFQMLSLLVYIGGYLVIQIGSNIALAAFSGVIPDLVPSDQRGVASGYMAVMSQFGTLVGALSSGFLLGSNLHAGLFLVMLVVFGLFVLFAVLGIKENPLTANLPKFNWSEYFRSLWIDPRKYPDFAWVWITRALMMLGFYSIQPYLLYYLRDVVHVSKPESTAAIVFGIILLAATFSGYAGGAVSDRTGRKPVVIWSTVVIAAMCIVLVFCQNLNQALAAGLIFGLGYGAYISVDWALGTDVLPAKKDAGKDMAVWHISMTLPQQIAPLLAGSLMLSNFKGSKIIEDGHQVQTYQWTGYLLVFTFAAICFLLSGLLVRKVRGAR